MRTGFFLIAICLAGALSAQTYSVTSGALTSTYTDLSGATNLNLTSGALSNPISPAGFSFDYFGQAYTSFKVGSGGYIIMGGNGTVISKFPKHDTAPGLVIAPLWTNLAPGSAMISTGSASPAGRVTYEYTGGVLVVEWLNVPLQTSASTGVRMQARLDTTAGTIEFRYGSVPAGCTGATSTYANACAISGPIGTATQEIIPGSLATYINNDGSISAYPVNRYVRFTPGSTPSNNPPTLAVAQGTSLLQNFGTINVNYGDTVAALNLGITPSDADSDPVSISASITSISATGIVQTEWESASATVPYTLNPSSGTFNTPAGVTHVITLTANDGTDNTVFTFNITQAAQPNTAPTVSAQYDDSLGGAPNMVPIGNGTTINVPYGTSLATLSMSFAIQDADGDPCSVDTTVSNIGGTGFVISEWESAGAGVPYTIVPATGVFNTVAGVTHAVSLTVNDGSVDTIFDFNITQAAQPATPSISVSDGSTVTPGQAAAGTNRAFGDLVVGTGPSAPLAITITNNGGAMLTLSNFAVTGDAGEFVLNTGWLTPGIGGGASTTFTIEFDPTSTGAKSATISFNHDDTNVANPFTFEITGNGTTSSPGPGPTPTGGGGSSGGGGCVAGSGANLALLLLIAMSACLGARTLRQRVSR